MSALRETVVTNAGGDSFSAALQGRLHRVLFVTPRYAPFVGGVETHVEQVAHRMASQGLDVHVLTTDRTRELPPREKKDGVQIHRVPAWPRGRDYYFAPRLMNHIQTGAWDILHLQSYHTMVAPMTMLAALRAGIPYVVTFHGGGHSSQLRHASRGVQQLLLRPLLRKAHGLVALTEHEVSYFSRRLGLPTERFTLIPNGSDLPPVEPGNAPNPKAPLIISVGRLERYKGHQRILAAMPHILEVHPNTRLWIIGAGPYENELRKKAERLGVAQQIEIRAIAPERRQEMANTLARASVQVLLSEFETHPIAVLEGLSLGLPAVVGDSPGLRQLAERGLAQAVDLSSTPRQIAEVVLEQFDCPQNPNRVRLPTWDECADGLLRLYTSIVKVVACES